MPTSRGALRVELRGVTVSDTGFYATRSPRAISSSPARISLLAVLTPRSRAVENPLAAAEVGWIAPFSARSERSGAQEVECLEQPRPRCHRRRAVAVEITHRGDESPHAAVDCGPGKRSPEFRSGRADAAIRAARDGGADAATGGRDGGRGHRNPVAPAGIAQTDAEDSPALVAGTPVARRAGPHRAVCLEQAHRAASLPTRSSRRGHLSGQRDAGPGCRGSAPVLRGSHSGRRGISGQAAPPHPETLQLQRPERAA